MAERKFDLEDRTFKFACEVRDFILSLPKNVANQEYIRQLVRSSGSIGANYIEANESLGSKDFLMRLKICRKEAKETVYWLRLVIVGADLEASNIRDQLLNEATQIMRIFTAICRKNA